jgi:UDP-glucose 4-epimerase
MRRKIILVTGAHGFLGRHVARCAAQRGYTIHGIGHGAWQREEWALWGLSEWHRSDVTLGALRQFADMPEAILHCAGSGSVPFSFADPWADMERSVVTTASVLEFIRTVTPSTRLVFPSSAGVYGIAEKFPISEESSLAPISPYGTHKRIAEELIASYSRSFGVRAAIVRFFSIFGAGLRKQFLWDACGKLFRDDLVFMGTGNEVRDWIYVEDAASLVAKALDNACSSCPLVNGGTGEGVSVGELLMHLAQCLGLNGVKPQFTGVTRAGDPVCYIAEIAKARAWGWEPEKHWKERVAEYADWWRIETGLHPKAASQSHSQK